ncbi:MAG: hypothetical protein RL189_30, partial [Pseudomonadota bacterium]
MLWKEIMRLLKVMAFLLFLSLPASGQYGAQWEEPSAELGVLLVGDQGKGNEGQRIVADAMARFCESNRCDFAFLLGDNFYNSGVRGITDSKFRTHFEDMYAKMGIEFWAVLGNHDYGYFFSRGNVQAQVDYTRHSSAWRMPTRYYSFATRGVQFVAIDTVALPRDTRQREWLDRTLQSSFDGFRVVIGHYPIHSGGQHGDTPHMRDVVSPKLCGNTHIYASGHDHHLEHLQTVCGVSLVLSGAGAETRPVAAHPRSVFSASKLGFAYLYKTADGVLSVRYLDTSLALLSE